MADIYFPRTTERAQAFFASEPDLLAQYQRQNPSRHGLLFPNQPYLLSCQPGDEGVLSAFDRYSAPELQRLQQIADAYDDYTIALAYVTEELIKPVIHLIDEHGLTAAGAMIGATNSKYTAFQRSIVHYQQALLDLHEASQAKSQVRGARARGAHNPLLAAKEAHARRMHADMTARFQAQLQRYHATLGAHANRSALLNPDRAVNVARYGRNNQRTGRTLRFANSQQVNTVQRFARGTQVASRGLLFIDAGVRANSVYRSDNRLREFITQYLGLGAGAAAGWIVGKGAIIAISALSLSIALTPVGWVLLVGTAAAVGFGAAYHTDKGMQRITGFGYDTASDYIRSRR